jgi:hypothetical protein
LTPARLGVAEGAKLETNMLRGACSRVACFYVYHMTTMIQIRNVPGALHRRLKSRAALAGMSLSDYLLSQIREVAERPTVEELRDRLERRSRVTPSVAPADAVRFERGRK